MPTPTAYTTTGRANRRYDGDRLRAVLAVDADLRVAINTRFTRASQIPMGSLTNSLPVALRACVASLSREGEVAGQKWLVALLRQNGPGLIRLLWRLLENEQDVMDTYQECVCRLVALERPGSLRNARAYAYRTASNLAIELIRRRKRRQSHWPAVVEAQQRRELDFARDDHTHGCQTLDAGGVSAQRELVQQLRACILALPAHLRDVMILRDLATLSYSEVGRILNIGAATARVYRCQAMARLADALEQTQNNEGLSDE